MNQEYFDKVTELEKMNASEQYILGWQEGYQGAPEVEEQRLTDAYEAGYEDGKNNNFTECRRGRCWWHFGLGLSYMGRRTFQLA